MNDVDAMLRDADPLAPQGLPRAPRGTGDAVGQEIAANAFAGCGGRTGTAPAASAVVRRLRTRVLAVGLISAGVLGVPTAAVAVRTLPGSVGDVFAYWSDEPAIKVRPESAVRAATGPGPDGSTFTVLRESNDAGYVCLAPLFESAASAAQDAPTDFEESGSSCVTGDQERGAFGSVGALNGGSVVTTFSRAAGDAVRAELRMPNGTTRPGLLVEGFVFGWYPSAGGGEPTLTGFDAAGAVTGEVRLPRRP